MCLVAFHQSEIYKQKFTLLTTGRLEATDSSMFMIFDFCEVKLSPEGGSVTKGEQYLPESPYPS